MSIGKAVVICENLDSEKYSLEEKALAIQKVMNMPTHMGVRKDTLIGMIKWLWNFNLEVSESHSGKRIVEIPTPHGRLIDEHKALRALIKAFPKRGMDFYIKLEETLAGVPTIIEAEDENV